MSDTKQQLMNEISDLARIPRFKVSSGSTEPRDFLLRIADQLGLQSEVGSLTKPEIARFLCISLGGTWSEDCESSGGTITKKGLMSLRDQLKFLEEI